MRLFFIRALVANTSASCASVASPSAASACTGPDKPQLFYSIPFRHRPVRRRFAALAHVDHYEETLNWVGDHAARCWDFGARWHTAASGPRPSR